MTCDDHTCQLTKLADGRIRVECLRCGAVEVIDAPSSVWARVRVVLLALSALVVLTAAGALIAACYRAAGRSTPITELLP